VLQTKAVGRFLSISMICPDAVILAKNSIVNLDKEQYHWYSNQGDTMTRAYIFLTALTIFMLMNFSFTIIDASSDSSFVNQQYIDQTNDWEFIGTPTGNFSILSPDGRITRFLEEDDKERCKIHPDIRGVSYNSDGKTIYATLWVSPLLINQSTSYSQVKNSWISGGYDMSIDIPSIYDDGNDFIYRILWNPLNQSWLQTLEERNLDRAGKSKIVRPIVGHEDFFDAGSKYVTFSLDRTELSLPDKYKIIFSTWGASQNDEGRLCAMSDTTSFIDIPPPLFNLSISDLPSHMRNGETINVPVHISSDSGSNTQATLEAAYNHDSIKLDITPAKVNMRPYSVADSLLEIKALDSKYPAQVTLNATISFLSSPVLQSGTVNSAPLINNISEEVRFSIGILPELGLLDYVNNVLSTWGAAASEAIALVASLGGAATAIVLIYKKARGQDENDKEENGKT
jgi:hypothetical protein